MRTNVYCCTNVMSDSRNAAKRPIQSVFCVQRQTSGCPESSLETRRSPQKRPANQGRLTVGGVAAKLSISSWVTQTFPVVWSCDTPQSQVREVCEEGRVMKEDRERVEWREKSFSFMVITVRESRSKPAELKITVISLVCVSQMFQIFA